jgi:H/ACA ribonucleoprotein complex subunit 2
MAKDRESSKPSHAHPEKEEKKSKKKRSDADGVHKSSADKKDKKDKKAKREALAEKALNEIQTAPPAATDAQSDEEGEVAETEADAKSKQAPRPVGALVPFANPLADEKVAKKVFKSVKKGIYSP